MLSNDIATQDEIPSYPINDLFTILLKPEPLALILKSLTLIEAMDFLDDHIIHNTNISEEHKSNLLNHPDMSLYAFLGSLTY